MRCPVCQHETDAEARTCPECGSPLSRESEPEASRPQEFARRLLGLDPRPEMEEQPRPAPSPPRPSERPSSGMIAPRTRAYLDLRPAMETVLEEPSERLRRQLGVAFAGYLVTLGLSGGLGFASSLSLLVLVLTGGDWLSIVGTAVLGVLGFGALAFLLYRPPESQRSGIAKLARLHAASASLDKLLRYWDATISTAADENLDVEAVSAAVHSLAVGCKDILDLIESDAPPPQPASEPAKAGVGGKPAVSAAPVASAVNGRNTSRY